MYRTLLKKIKDKRGSGSLFWKAVFSFRDAVRGTRGRKMPKPYLLKSMEELRKINGDVVVEIGSMRYDMLHPLLEENPPRRYCCLEGHSTAWWCAFGFEVHSVDLSNNRERVEMIKKCCSHHPGLHLYRDDGIRFLRKFDKKIDLLYLDAWDIGTAECAEKHLEAYIVAEDKLGEKHLVLIDDTDVHDGGKGRLLVPYLKKRGYRIVFSGRQTLLTKAPGKIRYGVLLDMLTFKGLRNAIEAKRGSKVAFWRCLVECKDCARNLIKRSKAASNILRYGCTLRAYDCLKIFSPSQRLTNKTTVKVISTYFPEAKLKRYFSRFTKGNYTWNNIQLTNERFADYYVILNHPNDGRCEYYDRKKTIVFQIEPESSRKRWFWWYKPDKRKFLYVFDTEHHRNTVEWHLGRSYSWLMKNQIPKKTRVLSSVTSGLYVLPGHRKRLDFLCFIDDKIEIDVYGSIKDLQISRPETLMRLSNYCGSLPPFRKERGLFPYKYTFAAENSSERNYFTEKIVDAILSECLCFYWGCPNIEDYLDPRAYILLDLDDFEGSLETIRRAIRAGEWEKRITIIRKEKLKILNELQIMPAIERIINENAK